VSCSSSKSVRRLEPAGSQGVWGLDDYCFLPFYLGASQLVHHDVIKPSSIHADHILQSCQNEYMYLSSVLFVKQVRVQEIQGYVVVLKALMDFDHLVHRR
jgi:hypothetical protein